MSTFKISGQILNGNSLLKHNMVYSCILQSFMTALLHHRPNYPIKYMKKCLQYVKENNIRPAHILWDTFLHLSPDEGGSEIRCPHRSQVRLSPLSTVEGKSINYPGDDNKSSDNATLEVMSQHKGGDTTSGLGTKVQDQEDANHTEMVNGNLPTDSQQGLQDSKHTHQHTGMVYSCIIDRHLTYTDIWVLYTMTKWTQSGLRFCKNVGSKNSKNNEKEGQLDQISSED